MRISDWSADCALPSYHGQEEKHHDDQHRGRGEGPAGERAGHGAAPAWPSAWSSIQRRFSRIASVRRSSSTPASSPLMLSFATTSPTIFSSVALLSHSAPFALVTPPPPRICLFLLPSFSFLFLLFF